MNDYTVLVIDPPWSYGSNTGRTRTAEHHYETLRKPNVILAATGEHSEKPAEFYDLLRSIYDEDERMVDMYARKSHSRFDAWGNEAPATTPKD